MGRNVRSVGPEERAGNNLPIGRCSKVVGTRRAPHWWTAHGACLLPMNSRSGRAAFADYIHVDGAFRGQRRADFYPGPVDRERSPEELIP